MKIIMQDGLPIVSISLNYQGNKMLLKDILLDTGCATTIFDVDEVEQIGLHIDRANGRPKRMYGVGGESELCFEQTVNKLTINSFMLDSFQIQLGITKETYGFNGILGVDFMLRSGFIINFNKLTTEYPK